MTAAVAGGDKNLYVFGGRSVTTINYTASEKNQQILNKNFAWSPVFQVLPWGPSEFFS
jgi:hypothetical protein